MAVGIIGVDAGVTTGLAAGVFSPALRDRTGIWNALARGKRYDWDELMAPDGDTTDTGLIVCTAVMDRIADWNLRGMGVRDVVVAIEDFRVRANLMGGTGRDKLAPVFISGMLAGVITGSGWGRTVKFIDPSLSKKFATDDRMKRWTQYMRHGRARQRAGWIRGRPHATDAWRLVATAFQDVP
jgi:hypothetical protein